MLAVLKCVCEKEAATERRMRSISRNVSSLPCATCVRPNWSQVLPLPFANRMVMQQNR